MLMFYDLVKALRPQASGRRIGHLQEREIRRFLGAVLHEAPIQLADVHQNINLWSRLGKRLDVLCSAFGPGCLFYLQVELSDNL